MFSRTLHQKITHSEYMNHYIYFILLYLTFFIEYFGFYCMLYFSGGLGLGLRLRFMIDHIWSTFPLLIPALLKFLKCENKKHQNEAVTIHQISHTLSVISTRNSLKAKVESKSDQKYYFWSALTGDSENVPWNVVC
jgi:hypothetical protein